MTPDVTPYDPKVVLRNLLRGHWTDAAVTSEYADQYPDFAWQIDGHFESHWIHTGWHDDSSPYPDIGITFDEADPGTPTGFDATTGTGGLSAFLENTAYVDVFVPSNRDHTGGLNPKLYAWQLRLRIELILLDHAPQGDHPWHALGSGAIRSPDEPAETPIGGRWRIPVLFSDQKET